jgi:hypothetical protein
MVGDIRARVRRAQVLQELDVMTTAGKDSQQEVRIVYASDLVRELPRQL